MEGKLAKVLSWYDNGWGYGCRVGDLAASWLKENSSAVFFLSRNSAAVAQARGETADR